jgi:hypothetical protein
VLFLMPLLVLVLLQLLLLQCFAAPSKPLASCTSMLTV